MTKTLELFEGIAADGIENLFVTDGTPAGTTQLTDQTTERRLLSASDFTPFGNEVLFVAYDATGTEQLWATDGTPAGTSQFNVTGVPYLIPSDLTPLGDEVLFSAEGALAATTGTAAGTAKLTVTGLYGAVSDITPFGTGALFVGANTPTTTEIWRTDGTPLGTTALVPTGTLDPISPGGLTSLGALAVFEAYAPAAIGNGSLAQQLWVTDGTPSGTTELIVAGADPVDGIFGNGFTGFETIGDKALFDGVNDTADNGALTYFPGAIYDNAGLWVTDGTAGGTMQISTAVPQQYFHLGTTLLFDGFTSVLVPAIGTYDSYYAPNYGLWITDGTAGGTRQIAGSTNLGDQVGRDAYAADPAQLGNQLYFSGETYTSVEGGASGFVDNLFVTDGSTVAQISTPQASSAGLSPTNLTVLGNLLLFAGNDIHGQTNLFVMDGTSQQVTELLGKPSPRVATIPTFNRNRWAFSRECCPEQTSGNNGWRK